MKPHQEQSTSIWMATETLPAQPSLERDVQGDVCIVGAGMAGLTTAFLLAREGRKVIVLESREVASGQTQRTTAHLMSWLDDFYHKVEKVHGTEGIRLAAQSHMRAIDHIEAHVRALGIDCEFSRLPGYLYCAPSDSLSVLEQEFEACARAGMQHVHWVDRAPIKAIDTGRCLEFANQGQFHPLKYLARLVEEIRKLGGEIYTGTAAKDVAGGKQAHVTTAHGPTVSAKAIVVATNSPVNDLLAIHTKQAPYLTYAIGAKIAKGSVAKALYWDTLDSYHYVRLEPLDSTWDLLIVGGEDHKSGQTTDQAERHHRLETWTRQYFPEITGIEFRWSGMVMESVDGLAYIGRNPGDADNIYVATGDSGQGMTHGTIAGMLLSDLIQGRENPWAGLYDPSRKPVSGMAGRDFLIENANVGKQYVKDWLSPGDAPDVVHLRPDQGTVVHRGLSKVAVYCDSNGYKHEMTAVCPHLGCVVHWNNLEKVWDCPCHGSRFDAYGDVVNGPAVSPLKPLQEPASAVND